VMSREFDRLIDGHNCRAKSRESGSRIFRVFDS
jgi:hypothetical protein